VAFCLSTSGVLGADDEPGFGAAIEALIEVSRDPDPEVRLAALSVLVKQNRTEAIVKALRHGLQDDEGKVRQAAFAGLVELEGTTDEVLRLLVAGLKDPVTESIARKRLVDAGGRAVPYLIDAMKDDETTCQAVGLLGEIRLGTQQASAVTALTAALKSERSSVRLAATRSLGAIIEDERRAQNMVPRHRQYFEQLFKKYDRNADGSLTEDEWSTMSKNPQAADGDGDGHITLEEYARWARPR
jgi:hypothetical protein